jgi:hypothetical protein
MDKNLPIQAMKVNGREQVLALLVLNLDTRWRSIVNVMSRERTQVPNMYVQSILT